MVGAVQTVIGSRRNAATNCDLGTAEQSAGHSAGLHCGTGQSDQVTDVAPIERQLADPLTFNDQSDAGRSRLDQRRVRLHFDLLGDLSDCKYWIDYRTGVDLQDDPGLNKGTKS